MVKNLLGTNEKDYDFYLGGSDSCQGKIDSLNVPGLVYVQG